MMMMEEEMFSECFVKFLNDFNSLIANDDVSLAAATQVQEEQQQKQANVTGEVNVIVTNEELDGEILSCVLQRLQRCKCPQVLDALLARSVLNNLKSDTESLKRCYDSTANVYNHTLLWKTAYSSLEKLCKKWMMSSNPVAYLDGLVPAQEKVSVCAIKNGRRKMEDRHVIIQDINTMFGHKNLPHTRFYAIYDGHAGSDAASYSSVHLHHNIFTQPCYPSDVRAAIMKGFSLTDERFCEKAKREGLKSGTTALCCVVHGETLYIAWLGDSQAFLCVGGRLASVMSPHKPEREDEKQRIESQGGCIIHYGTWRVNGTLAISRAIGDVEYKPYVCSDADVVSLGLDGSEDFIVMACDGMWDVLHPDDAVAIVQDYVRENPAQAESVCEKLVQVSKERGSHDNVTVLVVFFRDVSDIDHPATLSENANYVNVISTEVEEQEEERPCLAADYSSPFLCDVSFPGEMLIEQSDDDLVNFGDDVSHQSSAVDHAEEQRSSECLVEQQDHQVADLLDLTAFNGSGFVVDDQVDGFQQYLVDVDVPPRHGVAGGAAARDDYQDWMVVDIPATDVAQASHGADESLLSCHVEVPTAPPLEDGAASGGGTSAGGVFAWQSSTAEDTLVPSGDLRQDDFAPEAYEQFVTTSETVGVSLNVEVLNTLDFVAGDAAPAATASLFGTSSPPPPASNGNLDDSVAEEPAAELELEDQQDLPDQLHTGEPEACDDAVNAKEEDEEESSPRAVASSSSVPQPDDGEQLVVDIPSAVEKIPDNVPLAEGVEDDESEDGEEWRFYRADNEQQQQQPKAAAAPDFPVDLVPSLDVAVTDAAGNDLLNDVASKKGDEDDKEVAADGLMATEPPSNEQEEPQPPPPPLPVVTDNNGVASDKKLAERLKAPLPPKSLSKQGKPTTTTKATRSVASAPKKNVEPSKATLSNGSSKLTTKTSAVPQSAAAASKPKLAAAATSSVTTRKPPAVTAVRVSSSKTVSGPRALSSLPPKSSPDAKVQVSGVKRVVAAASCSSSVSRTTTTATKRGEEVATAKTSSVVVKSTSATNPPAKVALLPKRSSTVVSKMDVKQKKESVNKQIMSTAAATRSAAATNGLTSHSKQLSLNSATTEKSRPKTCPVKTVPVPSRPTKPSTTRTTLTSSSPNKSVTPPKKTLTTILKKKTTPSPSATLSTKKMSPAAPVHHLASSPPANNNNICPDEDAARTQQLQSSEVVVVVKSELEEDVSRNEKGILDAEANEISDSL